MATRTTMQVRPAGSERPSVLLDLPLGPDPPGPSPAAGVAQERSSSRSAQCHLWIDGSDDVPPPPRGGRGIGRSVGKRKTCVKVDFRGLLLCNQTPCAGLDREARLFRTSGPTGAAFLSDLARSLKENRHGLVWPAGWSQWTVTWSVQRPCGWRGHCGTPTSRRFATRAMSNRSN